MRRAARALLAALLALGPACDPAPPNTTPDGAVRELVELMRVFDGHEKDARVLFELLSARARANLEMRAERYGAASGKTPAAWAMLVPSRMTPRFPPQTYTADVVGRHALVAVAGVGEAQRAHIPCVLEDGFWRVDVVLPELAPLQRRPGAIEP
jgi:hypothetical protein